MRFQLQARRSIGESSGDKPMWLASLLNLSLRGGGWGAKTSIYSGHRPTLPICVAGTATDAKSKEGTFLQLDRERVINAYIAHMKTTDMTPKLFPYE